MLLDDLLRSEWFYRSPGPLSLIYYGSIVLLGARLLRKRVEYPKWGWLNALTESFFLNGFIILTADFLWMLVSGLRFLPAYPDSFSQVVFVLARDCAGIVFCFLIVGKRMLDGVVSFKDSTGYAYFTLMIFLIAVFGFATSPVQTDWTYAIRMGSGTETILTSLIFSYGLGKAVGAVLIWTWWKND